MNKKALAWLSVSAVLLVALFLASSTDVIIKEKKIPVYNVSVLIDNEDGSGFENFRIGMDEAALRYNVDINFVTLYSDSRPYMQTELLLREAEAGAQGFIISAENGNILEEMLEKAPAGIPIFVVGSPVDSPRIYGGLCPDYEGMAKSITERLIKENGTDGHVTVVTAEKNKTGGEKMCRVMLDVCRENDVEASRVSLGGADEAQTLLNGLSAQGGNIVITPEIKTLEALAAANEKLEKPLPVYGVGFSGVLRRHVESGHVNATAVYDSYSAGYIAVEDIISLISGKGSFGEFQAGYIIADKNNMYTKENETILFPIY